MFLEFITRVKDRPFKYRVRKSQKKIEKDSQKSQMIFAARKLEKN